MLSHDLSCLADYLTEVDPADLSEEQVRHMAATARACAATARELEYLAVPADQRAPVVICDGKKVLSFFRRRRMPVSGPVSGSVS